MTDLLSRLQTAFGDGYVVDRELDACGMSRVFHATETALRREVVVKAKAALLGRAKPTRR